MENQSEYTNTRKTYERIGNTYMLLTLILFLLGLSSWLFDLDIEKTTWLKVAFALCGGGIIFCAGFGSGWDEKEKAIRENKTKYDGKDSEEKKDISEEDLEQDGGITLFRGKRFTGVCVDYFEEDSSDPTSHHKYEKHYKNGKQDGLYTVWYHYGAKASETLYKNGKPNGLRTCWYAEDKKMSEEHYKDGVQEGLQISWMPKGGNPWNDDPYKSKEEYYKNDVQDGISTHFYPNGKRKVEKNFKEGKENGLRTEWDEDGNKTYQGNFVDRSEFLDFIKNIGEDLSEKYGVHTEWHPNGKKKVEKHFKDNKENGLRIEWDEDGRKIYEKNFTEGNEQ